MNDPDVLTKDQVALMLDCEPATVDEKARIGELPAVKFGRSWVFPRAALVAKLSELAMQPKVSRESVSLSKRQARQAARLASH